MASERLQHNSPEEPRIRLIDKRQTNGRTYNLPTTSEMVALIVSDFDESLGNRDMLLETRYVYLKRINELNASYLARQYPLLLPYGEDGYRDDIFFSPLKHVTEKSIKHISVLEFLAFRMHDRMNEMSTILSSRRLYQQFLVDVYGLEMALSRGDTKGKSCGKRIILPSSLTGDYAT